MIISGYRAMWVIVLFDLPTNTQEEKRNHARFRESIRGEGFTMLQYSVYARSCPSEENAQVHCTRVQQLLPPKGEVRILLLTDKQFGRMKIFVGRMKKDPEDPPKQLELF